MVKPWHITVLVILLVVIAFAVAIVRAYRNGKRGD